MCVCLSERIGSLRVVCVPCFQICECKSVTGVLRWCVRGGRARTSRAGSDGVWCCGNVAPHRRTFLTARTQSFVPAHPPTLLSILEQQSSQPGTGTARGSILKSLLSFVQFNFFEGASFRLCCRTVLPVVQSVAHRPPWSHSCFCSST